MEQLLAAIITMLLGAVVISAAAFLLYGLAVSFI
jgi:hypothetical protein